MVYSMQFPVIRDLAVSYYVCQDPTVCDARVYPPHVHDTLEAYVLLEGDVSFSVEGTVYPLHPGDILLSRPGEIHHCILRGPSVHRHMCFWFNPAPEFLFAGLLHPTLPGHTCLSPQLRDRERLAALGQEWERASQAQDQAEELTLLLELLSILRRSSPAVQGETPVPESLRAVMRQMEREYATIQNLDALAAQFFMSRSTLDRLFRAYLHITPRQYLEDRRMAGACILLQQGHPVSAVCTAVGMADQSHFTRQFRRRFGITPSQYRHAAPVEYARSPYTDTVK